jgi:hypothetical protein
LCDAAPGLHSTKGDFMGRGAGSLGLIFLSLMPTLQKVRAWFMPLSAEQRTLGDALRELAAIGLEQSDIPFITVDLATFDGTPLGEVRLTLGIEEDLLRAYYAIERRRFPDSPESQRLLD